MFKWLIGDPNRGVQERQNIAQAYITVSEAGWAPFERCVNKIAPFRRKIEELKKTGPQPKLIHMSNDDWDEFMLHFRVPYKFTAKFYGIICVPDDNLPNGTCVIETEGPSDRITPRRVFRVSKQQQPN